jgi:hypothetical protein
VRAVRIRPAIAAFVLAAILIDTPIAAAVEAHVPIALQATLLARIAAYDRALPARAGATVKVLVVDRSGDADSQRVAAQMTSALNSKPTIAGLPAMVSGVEFTDATALADACQRDGIAIVYVATALSPDEAHAVAAAFSGRSVLTVAADPTSVPDGVVLAFDLVSGQTQIVINLPVAVHQGVDFSSPLLGIARVIE